MTPSSISPTADDDDFGRSWYQASLGPVAARPALQGSLSCDVCVVGGGIAGTSAALHLAERGRRVVLLEQHAVGWGASGRSGAQALFGVACGEEKLERLVGTDDARAVFDVTVEGLALMRRLIARHRIACDYVAGQIHVAVKPRQVRELAAWRTQLAERYGYTSPRLLDEEEVREQLATRRYLAGMLDPNCGHLHPLKYVRGLGAAAERAGATIHENTRALRYLRESAGVVRVTTPHGEVRCSELLLAGNAWLGDTAPPLTRTIMNVGTFIVATEPLGADDMRALIRERLAVSDVNWVLDYFRPSSDHRLLFGGRVSYSGRDRADTARATRARMVRVFPQLAATRIDYAWGGYVDITVNRAPHFGRLAPNVYFLQGFSGHGMALAGIAGVLVADAMAGTAERSDVFARIPHAPFVGGRALRRPALVLAMLYYRLKDLF